MSLYDDASLVMIPSGYKDGKLYSVKPSDGAGDFTFTRGSNLAATRVDENGLIEKGRENLLTYSNDFSQWPAGAHTRTSGYSGYDGTNDAWLVEKTTTTNSYIFSPTISVSGVWTYSVYAKADTLGGLVFYTNASGAALFNIEDGLVVTGSNASIESVGNGWYRCSQFGVGSITETRLKVTDKTGVDVQGTIYIQDAQLEVGLVATDYIETTTTTAQAGILEDMPRLDYSGGTCPALLLEPQRTQLVGYSEYFDGSYWPKADVTIENNATTSPQGKLNASKFVASATNANHLLNKAGFLSVTSGDKYTFSIFAKAAEYDFIRLQFQTGPFPVNYANFDLTNGTLGLNTGATDTKIESVGNGWYKCVLVVTATSTGNSGLQPFVLDSDRTGTSPSYLGDGTSGIYIWGAQLEEASYPTSYIPTYGTSVTRGKDAINEQILGLTSLGEGTFFLDFDRGLTNATVRDASSDGFFYRETSGFPSANAIEIATEPNGNVRLALRTPVSFLGSAYQNNTLSRYKMLVKWNGSEVKMFVNGSLVYNSATKWGEMTAGPQYIGYNADFRKSVNQVATYPTALSDADCIALTTIA